MRNNKEFPITITARCAVECDSSFSIKYINDVVDIKYGLYKHLDQVEKVIEIEEGVHSITLKPHSTYFLGYGSNFNNFVYQQIIIENDSNYIILDWNSDHLFKKGKNFLTKYYAYYDIE